MFVCMLGVEFEPQQEQVLLTAEPSLQTLSCFLKDLKKKKSEFKFKVIMLFRGCSNLNG